MRCGRELEAGHVSGLQGTEIPLSPLLPRAEVWGHNGL